MSKKTPHASSIVLKPFDSTLMKRHPVSTHVNHPENDDQECTREIPEPGFPAFIVCALSAAILASACAIVAILHKRTGLLRDFLCPHQYDPLAAFGAIFLAVLIVLLAYYHLGRLGFVVMLLGAFASYYGIVVCAICVLRSSASGANPAPRDCALKKLSRANARR